MTWKTEIGTIVRHLIDDVNAATYSDRRIETAILVGAQLMFIEVDFEQTYTINVDACSLSPDPTDTSAKDDGFINLTALKTACIILGSELKAQSLSSIRVSDGPSSIDTTSISANIKFLYEHACKKYEEYKLNYQAGNNNVGKAILTPYSPGAGSVQRYHREY